MSLLRQLAWRSRRGQGVWLREHRWFLGVLLVGALFRGVALLGFRPILWFNDGFEYLGVAQRWQAYPIRPAGYSAFLVLLRPLHSFAILASVQHLLGLVTAALVYALLRHRGVAGWLATLGVVPQLLDVHQIQLEHMVLSDTLFTFLVVVGLVLLAWHDQASIWLAGGAGLALGLAVVTRTVGLPLLMGATAYLLLRRPGWRPAIAFLALALIPIGGYATYFHTQHGKYALNTADGVFLYSRVMAFADCAKMAPPPDLQMLCDQRPVPLRPPSQDYIWHPSPLNRLPTGADSLRIPADRFSSAINDPALRFALLAIRRQPLQYLGTGTKDFLRSFALHRPHFPNNQAVTAFDFRNHPIYEPSQRVFAAGGTSQADASAYERGTASTRVESPWSIIMIDYQKVANVPGPALLAFLLVSLGVLGLRRRDDRRWLVGLFAGTALVALLVPPFTAEYDFRYVLPALPLLGASTALAVAMLMGRRSDPSADTPHGSAPEDLADVDEFDNSRPLPRRMAKRGQAGTSR